MLGVARPPAVRAQAVSEPARALWVDLAAGPATIGGLSGGVAFNYQRQHLLLTATVDGQYSDEWFSDEDRSLWEYGLLAGMATETGQRVFGAASAGMALTGRRRCTQNCGLFDGPSEWDQSLHPGLPLQVRFAWRPLDFLGIGLLGMANLNLEESFASLNLHIQLGDLR